MAIAAYEGYKVSSMRASAEAAVVGTEHSVLAADTGVAAAAKAGAATTNQPEPAQKPEPAGGRKSARAAAAEMPAPAVKSGPVPEPDTAAPIDVPDAGSDEGGDAAAAKAEVISDDEQEAPVTSSGPASRFGGGRPGSPGGPTPIPRMPAKAEVFVEGDHVVYPTHGVGKVERIATEE